MKNFDWVIYVKDTQLMKGPLKEPLTIDLEAVNTSGDRLGQFTGSATISRGKIISDVSGKFVATTSSLSFTLGPSSSKG